MKQQGYSPKEFAEIFNISDKTVYKKIHSGMIPVYPFVSHIGYQKLMLMN